MPIEKIKKVKKKVVESVTCNAILLDPALLERFIDHVEIPCQEI